jgi:hypothetical protein
MPITLPISRLVNVNVTLTAQAAQAQALNNALILGSSGVIDVVTRMRTYTTLTQVANDFGTSAPEYLAAVLWFEQSPQPTSLLIGEWAKAATPGEWFGGPLTATQQLIATWNAITTPTFEVSLNGTPHAIAPASFATAANLPAVAALIQTALAIALSGTTCTWDSVRSRFVITSPTTGSGSTVSLLTVTGSGTDISVMMSGTSGAYLAPGIVAETALAAVTLFDQTFAGQWYGLAVLGAAAADHTAIAGYIEGATTKHFYGVTDQEANVLVLGDTTTIAYALQQLAYSHTAVQYSSTNLYAVVSLLARILTTDWDANSTAITLMYKQEPGIVAENLTTTQITALEAKNCNVFVAYNNNTAIIEQGVSSSGQFIDTVIGIDALSVDLQTDLYNALFLSTTKIPQTDAGTHILTTIISNRCALYQADGLLAPGVWTGPAFGALNTGDTMSKGYYVFAPPVATQSSASRAARVSVPISIACKLAGAVHTVSCLITVVS